MTAITLTPDEERQLRAALACSRCGGLREVREPVTAGADAVGPCPDCVLPCPNGLIAADGYDHSWCGKAGSPRCDDGVVYAQPSGPVVLVIEGDPKWCCAIGHDHDTEFVAPQRWVNLTGPCENSACDRGLIDVGGDCNCGYGGFHEPLNPRCHRNGPCPDCRDGRKRTELRRVCAGCNGSGSIRAHGCWPGFRPCLACDVEAPGSVLMARCCVEVLPVVYRGRFDTGVRPCVQVANDVSGQTWIASPAVALGNTGVPITLDRVPVPGRDWVVVLTEVELA